MTSPPPHRTPPASSHPCNTSSSWHVTPTTATRWSPVMLPGSPNSWIMYISPSLSLPRLCLQSSPLSVACSRTPLALLLNNTWDLVAQPPRANVITSKWIFKCKLKVDDSLDWYKGCWVLWGFTQCPRVDYDETSTRRQVCHRSDYSDSSYLYGLDYALARRQGCLPPRHTL
jgi:hypothetical protein